MRCTVQVQKQRRCCFSASSMTELLGKSPLANKMQKNNVFFVVSGGHADEISLLKAFLHNCGRADISFKQFKKLSRIIEYHLLFQKVKKTHGQTECSN